jgi:putative FmdB family regulatory protein
MPTYEYKCENCGNEIEVIQSIKAEPLKHCDKCGKETLKRMISAGGGLIFKGSGFYLTDYKNKPSESSSSSSSSTKSTTKDTNKEEKTSETKTESKADSKTDNSKSTSSDKTDSKSSSESKSNTDKKK